MNSKFTKEQSCWHQLEIKSTVTQCRSFMFKKILKIIKFQTGSFSPVQGPFWGVFLEPRAEKILTGVVWGSQMPYVPLRQLVPPHAEEASLCNHLNICFISVLNVLIHVERL